MGCSYYFDRLGPVLQECCQNVEPLIYLAIGVNEIRVVHSEDVVDTDVNINACQAVFVLEKWDFYGWYVA
jgi:hypothetical protein